MRWNTKLLISILILFNILVCSFAIEIIVKFKDNNISKNTFSNLRAKQFEVNEGRSLKYAPNKINVINVEEKNMEEILAELNSDPNVEFAHYNYKAKLFITPNDSFYQNYSDYRKLFSLYGAETAWDITTGSEQIIVAVIDTGINYNHPDLVGRVLSQDGKNFINQNNLPMDDHSHGTHVAGIIGANGNNGIGVTGMDWNCKLLPVKILDSEGYGNMTDLIEGIYFAIQKGAKILNLSLGFEVYVEGALQEAIDYAYSKGVIIVVAAGNDSLDISSYNKQSPVCNDGNSNKVIGVASLATENKKSYFSNYSNKYIDVSAFGSNIYSTVLSNGYAIGNGTSMAAPAVSGIIALLLSIAPGLSPAQVMDYIKMTAESVDDVNYSYTGKLGAGLIRADNLLSLYQEIITSTKHTGQILHFYNYPNPVDASIDNLNSTTFYAEFTKPVNSAKISIYSITGRKVHEINVLQLPNTNLYTSWDLGTSGISLPSGPYIAVLKAIIDGKEISKHHKVLIQ